MAGTAVNVFLHLLLTLIASRQGLTLSSVRAVKQSVISFGDEKVSKAVSFSQRFMGKNNDSSCYKNIGCFPMDYPWTSLLRPLPAPDSPSFISVKLYCYTRADPRKRYTVILWPDILLDNCPIRPNRKLVLVTHGFLNNGNATWMNSLKDYYLRAEDVTVCLVDWGKGSERLNYLRAASNTRIVGAELGRFLKYVDAKFNVKPKDVHLIGHSLGAQISAYAAKRVPGIQRLTALDPAQPAFEGCDKTVRLHKDDSDYVEVIHTNAAAFLPTFGFGMMEPVGDIDFYMNGGIKQPGCRQPNVNFKSILDLASLQIEALSTRVACSHGRAFEYFTQVLESNCTIWGRKATITHRIKRAGRTRGFIEPLVTPVVDTCDENTCIPIGLDTPHYNGRGVFIAKTSRSAPFCDSAEENEKIKREIALAKLKALKIQDDSEKYTHVFEKENHVQSEQENQLYSASYSVSGELIKQGNIIQINN